MLLLSRQNIEELFTMEEAIVAVKEAFMLFSQGKSQVPLRTQIRGEKDTGTFLFMPAYVGELNTASLKVVNIFPQNTKKGLPTAPAQVLLIDGQTGEISGILDGTFVTQLRTGAASGAAFDLLGRQGAVNGGLIGTGSQGACQLEAMVCGRNLKEVKVFSRNYQQTVNFAKEMDERLKAYGTKITAAKSSDEAIEQADLIITATPSQTPVFDGNKVKAGATISCVGSYQPEMQEMDPVILTRGSKLYFDSEEAVLSESGDILRPLEEGRITSDSFTGELGDVLLGRCVGRETEDEIIIFKSVGIGTQDLVTAKAIFDRGLAQNIGTHWG